MIPFAEGGHIFPPCHIFAYISANTRTSALKKLTFPNYKFGKGQYAFYPIKLSRFAEKMKFVRFTRISYELGQGPHRPMKNDKRGGGYPPFPLWKKPSFFTLIFR